MGISPQRRYHRRHRSYCQGNRPSNCIHGFQHQLPLPPHRRGHCSPYGQGGSGHNLPRGEVAEQHNYPLHSHHHEDLNICFFSPHAPTQILHVHLTCARWFLGPNIPNYPTGAQSQGVSGGLAYDQCGLGDLNIAFLSHSRASNFIVA